MLKRILLVAILSLGAAVAAAEDAVVTASVDAETFGDGDLGASRTARIGDEVSVSAELDRSSAYPGEQVTLSYHLYTAVSVTGIQIQESPPLTGFWVETLEVEPNPRGVRRIVNGRE